MKCHECDQEFESTGQKLLYAGKMAFGLFMAAKGIQKTYNNPRSLFDTPDIHQLRKQQMQMNIRRMNQRANKCNTCGRRKY